VDVFNAKVREVLDGRPKPAMAGHSLSEVLRRP